MTKDNAGTADDKLLRDSITRHAPRPSAAHNEAVMAAARANAARTRHSRLVERNRTWSGIGIAAVIVLAVGIWQLAPDETVIDNSVRGDDPAAEILPADNASLSVAPQEFRWTEVAGARRYKMKMYDGSATLLWESDWTDATKLTLPATAANQVTPGSSYFWTVELEGNGSRRSLGPYWFQVE